jgi:PhoH-like ATPase
MRFFKYGKQSGIGIYKNGIIYKFSEIKKAMHGEVKAKNREQEFALQLLFDDSIHLVTMSGKAGSGKTLLCLAAALQQVEEGKYARLLITKPMVPMGKHGDIGFLPGDLEAKITPWMSSVFDNLRFILGDDIMIEELMQKGKIELEALSLFRGRSLPNTLILVDESQNLNRGEAKTLVTRVGYNSKIILNGDTDQIDSPYIDSLTNGLTYVVEKMKDEKISGHITLAKGERSELATIAANKL